MFDIGFPELAIILIIALLVFGPGKLPALGSNIGKAIRDFKKALHDNSSDEKAEIQK